MNPEYLKSKLVKKTELVFEPIPEHYLDDTPLEYRFARFAYVNRVLKAQQEFKDSILPGDEIWWCDDIGFLCGSSGYAIVRNGEVVNAYIVCKS
jgi:hypothetical protein